LQARPQPGSAASVSSASPELRLRTPLSGHEVAQGSRIRLRTPGPPREHGSIPGPRGCSSQAMGCPRPAALMPHG